MFLEMVHAIQHVLWCQLYTLVVGGLLLLLILQLDSDIRNIIRYLGLVLHREVNEEIISC